MHFARDFEENKRLLAVYLRSVEFSDMVRFGTENALNQKGTGARRPSNGVPDWSIHRCWQVNDRSMGIFVSYFSSVSGLRPRFSRLARPTPATLKKIRDCSQSINIDFCIRNQNYNPSLVSLYNIPPYKHHDKCFFVLPGRLKDDQRAPLLRSRIDCLCFQHSPPLFQNE